MEPTPFLVPFQYSVTVCRVWSERPASVLELRGNLLKPSNRDEVVNYLADE